MKSTALQQATEMSANVPLVTMASLERLDLSPIGFKLQKEMGWELLRIQVALEHYRQFLFLSQTSHEINLVPVGDVDTVWHTHILDTAKYAEDCDQFLGCFLHHFPYAGIRSDEDVLEQSARAEKTRKLWQKTFGTCPTGTASTCYDMTCHEVQNSSQQLIRPTLENLIH